MINYIIRSFIFVNRPYESREGRSTESSFRIWFSAGITGILFGILIFYFYFFFGDAIELSVFITELIFGSVLLGLYSLVKHRINIIYYDNKLKYIYDLNPPSNGRILRVIFLIFLSLQPVFFILLCYEALTHLSIH